MAKTLTDELLQGAPDRAAVKRAKTFIVEGLATEIFTPKRWHPRGDMGTSIFKCHNVAGYHFHFLSADRTKGGHLLDCTGSNLRVRVERLNDFHLSLPESEEYLRADLLKDTSKELAYAEQIHKKGETTNADKR